MAFSYIYFDSGGASNRQLQTTLNNWDVTAGGIINPSGKLWTPQTGSEESNPIFTYSNVLLEPGYNKLIPNGGSESSSSKGIRCTSKGFWYYSLTSYKTENQKGEAESITNDTWTLKINAYANDAGGLGGIPAIRFIFYDVSDDSVIAYFKQVNLTGSATDYSITDSVTYSFLVSTKMYLKVSAGFWDSVPD